LARSLADVFRAIAGKQYHSARNLLVSLDSKHPNRACVLAQMWLVAAAANRPREEAHALKERLANLPPRWPVVYFARMSLACEAEDFWQAWRHYVECRERFPQVSYGQLPALVSGDLLGLLDLNVRTEIIPLLLSAARDLFSEKLQRLLRLYLEVKPDVALAVPSRPLWPGRRASTPPAVRDVPALVRAGRLFSALQICQQWRRQSPAELAAWWNTLTFLLWLGKFEEAKALLLEMQQAGFEEEDVAEAWAAYFGLAQPWLQARKEIPLLRQRFAQQELLQRLLAHPAIQLRVVPPPSDQPDQPPRISAIYLLSGESYPLVGEDAAALPYYLAVAVVERVTPEGVEILWHPVAPSAQVVARLQEVTGQPVESVSMEKLSWGWLTHYPHLLAVPLADQNGVPRYRLKQTRARADAEHLLGPFVDLPRPELDGKTLAEAAQQAQLRPRLCGLLLWIEADRPELTPAVLQLRERLGLGAPPLVDPRRRDLRTLPMASLRRLDPQRLLPGEMKWLVARWPFHHTAAGHRLFWTVYCQRPDLRSEVDIKTLWASVTTLVRWASSGEQAFQVVQQLRDVGDPEGRWPAPLDELLELQRLVYWGQRHEVARQFWRIRDSFWANPTVRETVRFLLQELELVDRDGLLPDWLRQPGATPVVEAAPSSEQLPAAVVQPTAPESQLWLPPSADETPGQGPKLWVPGEE
jgi:tetratricopeptide (TPR) repeat protein